MKYCSVVLAILISSAAGRTADFLVGEDDWTQWPILPLSPEFNSCQGRGKRDA
jgi:hypothetical protein